MPDTRLPSLWEECRLGDVVDYGATQKTEPGEIPADAWVLELEDIEKDTSKVLQRVTFAQRQSKSTKNRFAAGDVLYGKLRPYLNKVVRADQDGYCSTEIVPLSPSAAIDGGYLFYWLKHPAFLEYVTSVSHGLNMPRLGTEAGKEAPFVLAPINEQKRIADKLDAVLAQVDACRERLDRIPAILKRFLQAVLTAATSGKLTEEWREERQRSEEWQILRLAEVGGIGRGKSKHRPRNDPRLYGGPYPFIQTGDIAQSGGRITTHTQTYSEFGLAQSKLWQAGTVCITIAANIADTAILEYPACFPDSVVGFVADPKKSLPEFIKWSIDVISDRLEAFAPATAQKNINLAVLNDVEFRCPPLDEQLEIVRRVEALSAYANRLEARYAAARAQVELLTPALVAKAFRGELVPPDLNDEPASVLLERIRAARAEQPTVKRGRKPTALRVPRAPKEKATMTKSRYDDDVKHKPYLAGLLRDAGGIASVEDLFRRAELPVTDFYKQLAWEVENGYILDDETRLEAA
jgi:type I restriction enzyme S subunit